jgi:ribulose-phosphate 3-epimerase
MFEVIPGILEKNWQEIENKIELLQSFSRIIHIDVIDGKFAPNATFLDPKPFEKYTKDFLFEAHLMVEEPINYLESFAKAGFKRFLGHIEHMSSQEEFVARGELLGEVGLALDANTPLENLKADYLDLDCILLMTVKAGLSAQEFLPEVLEKVKKIKEKAQIPVEVDGGINDLTLPQVLSYGANRFVTTSFLFSGSPKANYEKLVSLISSSNVE